MTGWDRASREHRAAVAALVEGIGAVPPDRWRRPVAPGAWSPAQIVEHLALSYEALLRELEGGPGMRMRVGPGMERLLRWLLLPHILFHRSFPLRARSPREARPQGEGVPQDEAARRLQELAGRFEQQLRAAGERPLTHPYFGRLPPVRVLRFCAVHLEHHRRQLPTVPFASA